MSEENISSVNLLEHTPVLMEAYPSGHKSSVFRAPAIITAGSIFDELNRGKLSTGKARQRQNRARESAPKMVRTPGTAEKSVRERNL